jgi:pyruvate dehydrogenase E2 component (dihydrolipoamide acetyltransferase)/2-oxoisovalerate dehydrogenase E2 component (dihydrolipoyl transacylase)
MEFHLPELGEGVYEAELVSWLVKPGETVKRGQNLMEVLTDKATMEVPSPFAGTIVRLQAEPGQKVKIGDVMLNYETAAPTAPMLPHADDASRKREHSSDTRLDASAVMDQIRPMAAPPAPTSPSANGPAAVAAAVKAAPSVRLLARKLGIDLRQVRGSGPDGRVLVEDLTQQMRTAVSPASRPGEPRPDYGKPGTRLKLVGLRRKIAEQMVRSKQLIPHYGYVDECDVTDLVRLRQALKESASGAGVRLTYLAFLVKAVVAGLKEVPLVNASLDDQAGEIVLHDRYHIGIAVAAPQGLIVPVVHDADKKDLFQVAREIDRLSADARTGKARLEDLRGGTFTITSIGNIGGLFSTPVINHPEVGILGVGKIVKRPVFDEAGQVKAADMAYLSFSFDHRVVDGAVGTAFGNVIAQQLRKPALLLFQDRLLS